jgi:hypothetical protein
MTELQFDQTDEITWNLYKTESFSRLESNLGSAGSIGIEHQCDDKKWHEIQSILMTSPPQIKECHFRHCSDKKSISPVNVELSFFPRSEWATKWRNSSCFNVDSYDFTWKRAIPWYSTAIS